VSEEPSKITKEWFAKKPAHVEGQLELSAEPQMELGEKETDPEPKPLTAAEIVARRLRGAK
jgi:hypothetical protein